MGTIVVLSDADIRALVDLDRLFGMIEEALQAIAGATVSAPGRVAATTPFGGVYVMPGYVPSMGLATKVIANFPANPDAGLPSHHGLVALFDAGSGVPLAVMNGAYLTAIRTAATTAVATRVLSDPDASVLGLIGAGVQAAAHLQALTRVRAFREIRIASRTYEHAKHLAARWPGAHAVPSFQEAISKADVVCGCIDSREPAIQREWLKAGAHVNSVGGFLGAEVDEATVRDSVVYVESLAALEPPPVGSAELGGLTPAGVVLLGDVLSGLAYRPRAALTLYKSTGHAAEDVAVARHVYDRAVQRGTGVTAPF